MYVQFTAGRRRVISILRKRFKIATSRLHRARRLVKANRVARRLVRPSPYAGGMWGIEGTGISPSLLDKFRAQVAGASGINAASRCATTTIRIAFEVDLAEVLFGKLVGAFFRWTVDPQLSRDRLRSAWRVAIGLVIDKDGSPLFSRVVGPIAALAASLTTLGWLPSTLESWVDHEGARLAVQVNNFPILKQSVLLRVRSMLWQRAALHHHGVGLEKPPPHAVSFRLARKLVSESLPQSALLECIFGGGALGPSAGL